MGEVRRGGYIFITWKGDHSPPHVYRGRKLVMKWDLENGKTMKGKADTRILELIEELELKGLL